MKTDQKNYEPEIPPTGSAEFAAFLYSLPLGLRKVVSEKLDAQKKARMKNEIPKTKT